MEVMARWRFIYSYIDHIQDSISTDSECHKDLYDIRGGVDGSITNCIRINRFLDAAASLEMEISEIIFQ